MYRALKTLMQKISWSKVATYDTDYGQFGFQDDATHKTKQLEGFVKAKASARAEERKVAEKGERDGLALPEDQL